MINLRKWSFSLAILFLIIARLVYTGKIEIKCPEFCECDVFQNLRRAVCQHKRLVSIELNIPSQAQILDISDNQISELGDKIFLELGLTELKLLNLSHNKLHKIHFNGFEGLENLKTLDLSFNAVQYFTESWFASLSSLQELYLRENKLKSINTEPLINIKTLKVLDISKCGITHLESIIFSKVPNLEILDISENYLQRFKVDVIKPLSNLTILKAHDNNFNCRDRLLINVKNYIRKVGISYKDPCIIDTGAAFTVNSHVQKFEKIIMASDVEATTSMQPKNFWILDDKDINNTKIIEVCSNDTKQGNDLKEKKSLLAHVMELYPIEALCITFIYGVFSGMVIICAINLCIRRKKLKNKENTKNNNTNPVQSLSSVVSRRGGRRRDGIRTNSFLYTSLQKAKRQISGEDLSDDDDFDDSLVMHEFDLANSTPMQERKTYH